MRMRFADYTIYDERVRTVLFRLYIISKNIKDIDISIIKYITFRLAGKMENQKPITFLLSDWLQLNFETDLEGMWMVQLIARVIEDIIKRERMQYIGDKWLSLDEFGKVLNMTELQIESYIDDHKLTLMIEQYITR